MFQKPLTEGVITHMAIPYEKSVRRVLSNPNSIRGELLQVGVKFHRQFGSYYASGDPVAVMDEEWDNLIILDACRYDLFRDHSTLPGSLQKVRSAGSQSREFMEYNFADEYHDTVYITSNPFTTKIESGVFHAIIDLFDDSWDEEILTVRPESVVSATTKAHKKYPNKRLISHFMQPHYPFIGSLGQQIESGGVTGHTTRAVGNTDENSSSIWSQLDSGTCSVDRQTVWDAYVENFKLVEEHVEALIKELDGKTVVTSDHGNLFGRRLWPIPLQKYGHPPGLRFPELIEVPWHEPPFNERREVCSDPPEEAASVSDETVEDRLKHLGYA